MIEVSVLVDKLNGMKCDEIAQYLKEQEVVGYSQDETHCPIANWIRRESGKRVAVGVWHQVADGERTFMVAEIDDCYYEDGAMLAQYPIAEGPQNFIGAFDNGRFEELLAFEEDCE